MDVKVGRDSAGLFAIVYGPKGVRWLRGGEAHEYARRAGIRNGPSAVNRMGGYAQLASSAIEAIGQLCQWYEMRQMRLLEEAQFEERRIGWLVNCANMVLNDAHDNARVDAKAAYYLARDAGKLFEACENNSKLDIPGTVLFLCHGLRQNLAEFNIASYEFLSSESSELRKRGLLSTGSPIYGKLLDGVLGGVHVPNDSSWLEYHSAEEQLEAVLALMAERKPVDVNWKDVAKSAALLAAFVPIPAFFAVGTAARLFVGAGSIFRGASAVVGIKPLLQIAGNLLKSMDGGKRASLIMEYRDLVLLGFEAANTARLLTVQGQILAGADQQIAIIGQSTVPLLTQGNIADSKVPLKVVHRRKTTPER